MVCINRNNLYSHSTRVPSLDPKEQGLHYSWYRPRQPRVTRGAGRCCGVCSWNTDTRGTLKLFLGGRKIFHSLLQPANAIHQMERKTTNTLSILSKLNSTHDRFKNGGYRLWYKSQQGSAKVTISWLVLWSYPWEVLRVCWNWASSSLQVSRSEKTERSFSKKF